MPPETYLDYVTFKIRFPMRCAHGDVTAECNEVWIKVANLNKFCFDRRTHNETMHY